MKVSEENCSNCLVFKSRNIKHKENMIKNNVCSKRNMDCCEVKP